MPRRERPAWCLVPDTWPSDACHVLQLERLTNVIGVRPRRRASAGSKSVWNVCVPHGATVPRRFVVRHPWVARPWLSERVWEPCATRSCDLTRGTAGCARDFRGT